MAFLTFHIVVIVAASEMTYNPGGGIQYFREQIPPPGSNEQSDEKDGSSSAKMPKPRCRYAKKLEVKLNVHVKNRRNA